MTADCMTRCDRCGIPLGPDEDHQAHEHGCVAPTCTCDIYWCPECCAVVGECSTLAVGDPDEDYAIDRAEVAYERYLDRLGAA